jgi:hypothetical protein
VKSGFGRRPEGQIVPIPRDGGLPEEEPDCAPGQGRLQVAIARRPDGGAQSRAVGMGCSTLARARMAYGGLGPAEWSARSFWGGVDIALPKYVSF